MNIVITGCSRGIGLELVKIFSIHHNVYCLSRNIETIQSIKTNSDRVFCKKYDLIKDSKEELLDFLNLKEGINVLINNAGYLHNAPFQSISEKELQKMYEVNVMAPFRLMQTLMPQLIKGKAHVVNISSMGGVQGSVKFPGLSAYSSSKGAMAILTECLAEEFKDEGMTFNCLALGAVQTEMLKEAFPDYEASISPKEMASYIHDFSLKSGRFINGKVISVSNTTP